MAAGAAGVAAGAGLTGSDFGASALAEVAFGVSALGAAAFGASFGASPAV